MPSTTGSESEAETPPVPAETPLLEIAGLFLKLGTIGFGAVSVKGFRRVPNPPAEITA